MDENALIFRTPWNAFPDITVQTTVAKLKAHPDYDAAKSGDQDAALRVIDQVFKPGKLTDSCDLIVPVLQPDQGKQNMLAVAYALRLGRELGAEVFLGICQSNQVSHTGADAITRILGQPTFVGQIAPGRRVVIVNDVATFGSTLANLRGWIEHQGAHVIGYWRATEQLWNAFHNCSVAPQTPWSPILPKRCKCGKVHHESIPRRTMIHRSGNQFVQEPAQSTTDALELVRE